MTPALPSLLEKSIEDILFGQLDQRRDLVESTYQLGRLSDEVYEAILEKVEHAWSELTSVSANSMSLGRRALDAAVDTYIEALSDFDQAFERLLAAGKFIQPR